MKVEEDSAGVRGCVAAEGKGRKASAEKRGQRGKRERPVMLSRCIATPGPHGAHRDDEHDVIDHVAVRAVIEERRERLVCLTDFRRERRILRVLACG